LRGGRALRWAIRSRLMRRGVRRGRCRILIDVAGCTI
jgi:hypothetical protein